MMSPLLALAASFAGACAFLHGSWTVAAQDLEMRAVLLRRSSPDLLPGTEADALLESAAARDTGRADVPLLLGEAFDRRGTSASPADGTLVERSAVLYHRAAVQFPAHALGQFRLAVSLLREGRDAEARDHIRTAARCAGNHPALLVSIGDSYLDHWKRARDPAALLDCLGFFRSAVERDRQRIDSVLSRLEPVLPDPADLAAAVPETPWARAVVALRLEARGKDAAAMALIETLPVLGVEDRRDEIRRARARIQLRTGRTAEGLDALGELLRAAADPDALVASLEGDLAPVPPAIRARFLAKFEASGPRTRLALARALRDAGDGVAALAAVNRVLADIRDGSVAGRLGPVERASLLACYDFRRDDWLRRGAPIQAAAEAVEAARLDPAPGRWAAAARLFAAAGEWKEADAAWDRALREVPKDDRAAEEAILLEMNECRARKGSGR